MVSFKNHDASPAGEAHALYAFSTWDLMFTRSLNSLKLAGENCCAMIVFTGHPGAAFRPPAD